MERQDMNSPSLEETKRKGESRAIEGLLREFSRGGQGDDHAFIAKVMDSVVHSGRIRQVRVRRKRRNVLRQWFAWVSVAACIVIVVGAYYFNITQAEKAAGVRAELVQASSGVTILRNGKRISGKPGIDILLNDTIQTHDRGKALVAYRAEATTISLKKNTMLRLREENSAKHLDLTRGAIECDVDKQPQGKPMIVKTPHAEVEVRGTRFALFVSSLLKEKDQGEGGKTRIEVHYGHVRLTRLEDGQSVDIKEGFYAVAGKGYDLEAVSIAATPAESTIDTSFSPDRWEPADDKGSESAWRFLGDGKVEETSHCKMGYRLGPFLMYRNKKFRSFKSTVTILNQDNDIVGMRFGYRGALNFFQVRLYAEREYCTLERFDRGQWTRISLVTGHVYDPGTGFKMGLEVNQQYVRVTVDGREILKAEGVRIEEGSIGIISLRNSRVVYRDFRIEFEPVK